MLPAQLLQTDLLLALRRAHRVEHFRPLAWSFAIARLAYASVSKTWLLWTSSSKFVFSTIAPSIPPGLQSGSSSVQRVDALFTARCRQHQWSPVYKIQVSVRLSSYRWYRKRPQRCWSNWIAATEPLSRHIFHLFWRIEMMRLENCVQSVGSAWVTVKHAYSINGCSW